MKPIGTSSSPARALTSGRHMKSSAANSTETKPPSSPLFTLSVVAFSNSISELKTMLSENLYPT